MNYLHNSQNGLDNITKKTFHQRHKMLLETIMVHLKVIPILKKKDEDRTAQDVDPEAQEGREALKGIEVREGLGVLKGLGNLIIIS